MTQHTISETLCRKLVSGKVLGAQINRSLNSEEIVKDNKIFSWEKIEEFELAPFGQILSRCKNNIL